MILVWDTISMGLTLLSVTFANVTTRILMMALILVWTDLLLLIVLKTFFATNLAIGSVSFFTGVNPFVSSVPSHSDMAYIFPPENRTNS